MILANYAQVNRNCNRDFGAAFTNPLAVMRAWNYPNCTVANTTDIALQYSGFPHGYNSEASYSLPLKSGGIASINSLTGTGTVSASALAVRLAIAALTGSGGISNAEASRIVQLLAGLSGSGTVSDANIQAFLQAVAALTGSGTVSATRTALGALIAALTGSGIAEATLTGTGELDADITVTGTGLTTANVGSVVWAAIASANNTAGSMGEKLNDAGSASNPWTEVIESGYTAAEILKLIAAAVQGDASGLESGAPTFKGLDGTTDRITATYSSGTRTVTGRDVT